MKKVFAFALALCLVLALAGCGNTNTPAGNNTGHDTPSGGETLRVEPLAGTIDVNDLADATLDVAFDAASLHTGDGQMTLDVTVYDYERYDAAEVSQLKVGDTIVANGQDMVITTIDTTNGVIINGGYEQGGLTLMSDDGGTLFAAGADDSKTYREVGTATLPVGDGCQLLDSSDLSGGEIKVTTADLAAFLKEDTVTFRPGSTTVTVTGGQITGIARVYMP